jgi:hypothetical protein
LGPGSKTELFRHVNQLVNVLKHVAHITVAGWIPNEIAGSSMAILSDSVDLDLERFEAGSGRMELRDLLSKGAVWADVEDIDRSSRDVGKTLEVGSWQRWRSTRRRPSRRRLG